MSVDKYFVDTLLAYKHLKVNISVYQSLSKFFFVDSILLTYDQWTVAWVQGYLTKLGNSSEYSLTIGWSHICNFRTNKSEAWQVSDSSFKDKPWCITFIFNWLHFKLYLRNPKITKCIFI